MYYFSGGSNIVLSSGGHYDMDGLVDHMYKLFWSADHMFYGSSGSHVGGFNNHMSYGFGGSHFGRYGG